MKKEHWHKITDLTAVVSEDAFADKVFELLMLVADITHYGVFIFDANRINDPELVFYGGNISDYWMKVYALNDRHATLNKNIIFDKNLEVAVGRQTDGDAYYRYSPEMNVKSEIQKIYEDSGTIEKYYLLHRSEDKLFQFNVYRSQKKGLFSQNEIDALSDLLPFLNNLVKLRTQICGAGEFQRRPQRGKISELKRRDLPYFKTLSNREAEVCDLIIFGLTTEGIAAELELSLSTVKTFRNRAYKKLEITSKSELFVMILNSRGINA